MMAVTRNRWVRSCAAGLACLLSLLAAGCGDKYYVGTRPVTAALETTLRPGESTPAEVIAALGKPSGRGSVMLPVLDKQARESWTYYFEKGHVKAAQGGRLDVDMRHTFLFVYFDDGIYDGYLWFSSLLQPLALHKLRQDYVGQEFFQAREAYYYRSSRGIEIDRLRIKAKTGDPEAQYRLAILTPDDAESRMWACLAANQGHRYAQARMGTNSSDLRETYMWYSLAASNGQPTAREWKEETAKKLTPAQITEAARMVAEWQPGQCEAEVKGAAAKAK